ncbi:sensor histidine kinase [Flaviflexus huanghaiensis]|uniref:sensor histidine kinase n=1 Tax=Flaviflexus huanghaiensis TaxID=1111473 RepID=UPI0018880DCE|nr:PAS domain-containing sensor histidine kinase [Flaviflexus huanghaiensis]
MINQAGTLDSDEAEHLHRLAGDWHPLADISFSDIFLIVRTRDDRYIIAAHTRPATAATVEVDDVVGSKVPTSTRAKVAECFATGTRTNVVVAGIRYVLVPIMPQPHRVIAVLSLVTWERTDRVPDQVQLNYTAITEALLGMMCRGEFPADREPTSFRHGTPRVSDGLIHLDENGKMLYASPNAISAFHRLGIRRLLPGAVLAERITEIAEYSNSVDEMLPLVVMGRGNWVTEVEARGVVVSLRAIELKERGVRIGAMLLCRDVTELRRSEREVMTKDAMIREINHRVKNNLQTVSALLRLQARRATDPGAKQSLDDAQRRIYTISMVHEALARTGADSVDFDETFARLMRLAAGVAATGQKVTTRFEGSFGKVHAEAATSLAVVLNEIVTNAVEHGLKGRDGTITVRAERIDDQLDVVIIDDGVGIKEGEHGSGLGTQIVETMVKSDLLGSISWSPGEENGTVVRVHAQIRRRD